MVYSFHSKSVNYSVCCLLGCQLTVGNMASGSLRTTSLFIVTNLETVTESFKFALPPPLAILHVV